jgi:antitoxin Phd
MRTWDMENATARFSELLEASLREGPQLITRGGIAVAVLVAVERWHRLQEAAVRR